MRRESPQLIAKDMGDGKVYIPIAIRKELGIPKLSDFKVYIDKESRSIILDPLSSKEDN